MPDPKTGSDETQSSASTANSINNATTSLSSDSPFPPLLPPEELEAKNYYAYLPSHPRLLGRSSGHSAKFGTFPEGVTLDRPAKLFSAVGPHPIHACWENLVEGIEDILVNVQWTSIDVWRVGYNELALSARPIVIMVAVRGGKDIPWATIAHALYHILLLLEKAGLPDVEVEFREGCVRPLAGPLPLLEPDREAYTIAEADLTQTASTAIGQSISPMELDYIEGTLCLYLRPKRQASETKLWALTCRHVALPLGHGPNTSYRRRNTSQPAIQICLPGASSLRNALATADLVLESNAARARGAGENFRAFVDQESKRITALQQRLKAFLPDEARVLGSVFLAPPIEQGTVAGKRFTRDWALVELNTAKFPGGLPINEVDLRTTFYPKKSLNETILPNILNPGKFVLPDSGFLRLSGALPLSSFAKTPTLGVMVVDEEHHLVGKRGAASGVTWGGRSDIKSRVRHFPQDPNIAPFTTGEWAVTGTLGDNKGRFSRVGDSGAAVFSPDGVVVGMVVAGSTSEESAMPGVDMTYITPMEHLLQDVEQTLGHEVVVL